LPAGPGAAVAYAASIPAAALKAGDMLRWAVAASSSPPEGLASRAPAPGDEEGSYYGTAIAEAPAPGALPVLHWCGA
jgi:hypothetical protein